MKQPDDFPHVRIDAGERRRRRRRGDRRRSSEGATVLWLLVIGLLVFAFLDSRQEFAWTNTLVGRAQHLFGLVEQRSASAPQETPGAPSDGVAVQANADRANVSAQPELVEQTDTAHPFRCVDSNGHVVYSDKECGGVIEIRRFAESDVKTSDLRPGE